MVETILREENSNSRIYIKDFGQIKLKDMSLSNDELCMTVVESLYSEHSLNPPFKKLDVDDGLLKKIILLSRDQRTLEYKHKDIEEIRDELKIRYSLNFS